MRCYVYRSTRKAGTYLYVANEDGCSILPETLSRLFGEPEKVMELELSPGHRLASEDAATVLRNLLHQGFHLQMPPLELGATRIVPEYH